MHSKNSPLRLRGLERRIKALKLRQEGLTYEQIGEEIGCSPSRAYYIIMEEVKKLRKKREEAAEVVTQLELGRLDRLLAGHFQKAESGDVKSLQAIIKIMERRAKLLGLDAPTKVVGNLSFSALTDDELVEEARRAGLEVPDELHLPQDQLSEESANEGKRTTESPPVEQDNRFKGS